MHEHFRTFAGFNRWANGQVYGAVESLPETEVRKSRPSAYFTSILGTLNHILVVDRLWFGRVAIIESGIKSLDQVLFEDFPALRESRQAEDARIVALLDGMDEAAIAGHRDYLDTNGNPWTMPVRQMLATVFNHQTHHRGQVHALLKEAGVEPPALDLPVYLHADKWK